MSKVSLSKTSTFLLLIILLMWRTFYGLSQNFWHEDILQIYLLGLKYFTTGLWPYFGPDIVHTQQQIPGAMQSILIGIPLKLIAKPESPFLAVNILSMFGIGLLAYFFSRRFKQFSLSLLIILLATLPVALQISTNIYNPSYLLFPSCLFFVAWFESQSNFRSLNLSATMIGFSLGFALSFTFQIHMSWPLLIPYLAVTFLRPARELKKSKLISGFIIGSLLGGSMLIPTLMKYGLHTLWAAGSKNSAFAIEQFWNAPNTILKLITLGTYDFFGFNLGASMNERISIVLENYLLLTCAVIMVAAFISSFIILFYGYKRIITNRLKDHPELILFILTSAWCAFIFLLTPRPAAIRNIFLLLPITVSAFLSCLSMLKQKYPNGLDKALYITILASVIFHSLLAVKMIPEISIYKDYAKINNAIGDKDYKILGERRPGRY